MSTATAVMRLLSAKVGAYLLVRIAPNKHVAIEFVKEAASRRDDPEPPGVDRE